MCAAELGQQLLQHMASARSSYAALMKAGAFCAAGFIRDADTPECCAVEKLVFKAQRLQRGGGLEHLASPDVHTFFCIAKKRLWRRGSSMWQNNFSAFLWFTYWYAEKSCHIGRTRGPGVIRIR